MGKRLGDYTRDNTKCMLAVNGVKLIDRALAGLSEIGISRVILVTGYKGRNVQEYLGERAHGLPIHYVDNPIFDKTNNIYSLFLAKDYLLQDDTILLESDIIFDPAVLRKLVEDERPDLAMVDKYERWMDGTVVTLDNNLNITHFIDKGHFRFEDAGNYYKTVNIYKFSKDFCARYYVPFLTAYCASQGHNAYYEQVLRVILHLHDAPLKALPLHGESWYEIDDAQDLDIASSIFAPTDEERYTAITQRFGGYWRYPRLLDFCYLVNPFFPPQRMLDEMKSGFEMLVRDYPSGMRVNALLASKDFSVRQDYILTGNGAAELIRVCMTQLTGKTGVIYPTFEEYSNRLDKKDLIPYIPTAEGFRYSAADIMDFFDAHPVDTLLLINPDNPSGNYIPFQDLLKLTRWAANKGIRFIVDESFVDFAQAEGQVTLLDNAILGHNPHLIVVKSISKSYGVPGLRLGILASGDTALILKLKQEVPIWNINSLGEYFMQIYEKYHSAYIDACRTFRAERESFYDELSQISFLHVYPSHANYFLCKVTDRYSARELALLLLQDHILIKDCSTKKGFNGASYIRLAVRSKQDNRTLIETLKRLQ